MIYLIIYICIIPIAFLIIRKCRTGIEEYITITTGNPNNFSWEALAFAASVLWIIVLISFLISFLTNE